MSLDVAKDTIDFLVRNYNFKKEKHLLGQDELIVLSFFGGEPTLCWDTLITPIIQYIEDNYDLSIFKFGMTTNGTLLDKAKIDFMAKYELQPLFSCDGDKFTQDYNRPCRNEALSSFDLINENIPYLLEKFPGTVIRSTIYGDTVDKLYENYLFAEAAGFKSCFMACDVRTTEWTEEKLKILQEQVNNIGYHILEKRLNKEPYLSFSNLESKFQYIISLDWLTINNTTLLDVGKNIDRCGLGTNGIAIGYDGSIFTCQEQVTRETNSWARLGDIYNGIDYEKHMQVLTDYYNHDPICEKPEYCETCMFKQLCEKGCASTQKDLFGNFETVAYANCFYDNLLINNAILMMHILVENDNEDFKKYLDEQLNNVMDK